MKQKAMWKGISKWKQRNQPNVIPKNKVYCCLVCVKWTKHFSNLRCRHRDKNAALNIREIGMWYLFTCYNWMLCKQYNNEMWNNEI
jgi:hypothetical protein